MGKYNKYALYEMSVQSPKPHVDMFAGIYKSIRGKFARVLKEDFCGTFRISCEWVKRNRSNRALGLDLDPEPLRYGKRVHLARLKTEQKKRLVIRRQNVL